MISFIQSILAFVALFILLNGSSCLSSRRHSTGTRHSEKEGMRRIDSHRFSGLTESRGGESTKGHGSQIAKNVMKQRRTYCEHRETRALTRPTLNDEEVATESYRFKLISKSISGVIYPKVSFIIENENGEILKRGITDLNGVYHGELTLFIGERLYFRLQGTGFTDDRTQLDYSEIRSRDHLGSSIPDLWN